MIWIRVVAICAIGSIQILRQRVVDLGIPMVSETIGIYFFNRSKTEISTKSVAVFKIFFLCSALRLDRKIGRFPISTYNVRPSTVTARLSVLSVTDVFSGSNRLSILRRSACVAVASQKRGGISLNPVIHPSQVFITESTPFYPEPIIPTSSAWDVYDASLARDLLGRFYLDTFLECNKM
jgi:hypothetical protein